MFRALLGSVLIGTVCLIPMTQASADPDSSGCPGGNVVSPAQVDQAADACDLAGKWLDFAGNKVLIPPAGVEVTLNVLGEAGAGSQEWTVANSGSDVTYDAEGESLLPDPGGATGDDAGCERDTYRLNGKRQPGSGPGSGLYISPGDGGNPAAATDAEFRDRIVAALTELTTATGCGYATDVVDIDFQVNAQTTYETDFVLNGDGNSVCAGYSDTDGWSTVDGGDLNKSGTDPVAAACTWTGLGSGTNFEADIRLNTNDYNFTLLPGGAACNNDYDLRSVLTHEFGHAYGLGDIGPNYSVGTTADRHLTMYGSSFTCKSFARSLGKGDILAMRALY